MKLVAKSVITKTVAISTKSESFIAGHQLIRAFYGTKLKAGSFYGSHDRSHRRLSTEKRNFKRGTDVKSYMFCVNVNNHFFCNYACYVFQ